MRRRVLMVTVLAIISCVFLGIAGIVKASDKVLGTDVDKPAEGNILVEVEGTFYTSGAKAALRQINLIRYLACRNGEPDYYGSTTKLSLSTDYGPDPDDDRLAEDNGDFHPVKWSSEIERACEIRACEAAIFPSHGRPNGNRWYSAFDNLSNGDVYLFCGCIAWNASAADAMETGIKQWEAERECYKGNEKGQVGHYSNLINPDISYIGLSAFRCKSNINNAMGNIAVVYEAGYGNPHSQSIDETPRNISGDYAQIVEIAGDNIESLVISGDESICIGAKKNLSLYAVYSYTQYTTMKSKVAQDIKWTSSDPSVAQVSNDGKIEALGLGTTVITAESGGRRATLTISVKSPIVLSEKSASVICGSTHQIGAVVYADDVKWNSSNTAIATVDSNGKVTAKMAGTVTITASAAGKTVTCVVTVLYKDVTKSSDFWYVPTNYLTAKGVVKGYDKQTKFKPANKCTRAQMVTFIWRLQGEPKPKTSKCKFSDVKKTDYFYKACIWGNENHIVEGYKDGTFGPQIVCARKHAVTFLWRLAGKPSPKSRDNKFKDVKKSDYFYTATLWASEQNILAGYSDGTFRSDGDCLRRQMVTFLYKYDKFVNGKG